MTTPIDHENATRLAVMEVEWKHMKATVEDLKFSNARQEATLNELLRTMHEAKGGWRVLLMMGGAAGTVGAFVTWALSHWKG
jgi:hypothetical protein